MTRAGAGTRHRPYAVFPSEHGLDVLCQGLTAWTEALDAVLGRVQSIP